MDDFSTPGTVNAYNYAPSPSNYITPGKRPMSSMSPTIVLNERKNQVVEVVGASGGSRIIAGTLQVDDCYIRDDALMTIDNSHLMLLLFFRGKVKVFV